MPARHKEWSSPDLNGRCRRRVSGVYCRETAKMSDLAEILQGEETEVVEQVQEVEQVAEVEQLDRPRDEHGRFVATGEPETPSPGVEEQPEEQVIESKPAEDLSSVVAGLKAELARVRQKLREPETPRVEQQKPDFWADPDNALQSVERGVDEKLTRFKLDWSEQAARNRYQDFDEKEAIFSQMVQENPALVHQMIAQVDPAEFVYKTAKTHQKLQQVGDIDGFEAKIRADERAKVEASFNAKIEAEIQKRLNVPKSLSDARSTGGNAQVVINESLEDILKR